ncbi:hypothetical protein [Dehalococcoides mccartyi]|uniref:Reductive dehalogenase anchoring protein n=1 Tax=Dehalococcoides mccartyi (strain VS) TaxID=311424 RepID=D2BG10_DEHMV|nr:hypothetical protein [Dehalococcoides mccartyi]ACZ61260.1 reductive dehalogenase anchoring protein [Dehalococcoides mccartyi VS]
MANLLVGILLGAVILMVFYWIRSKHYKLTWYEWVIGILGALLLLFTIQNFLGSFAELQTLAAYLFLLVTGLPSLIMLAVVWQLVVRRAKKT